MLPGRVVLAVRCGPHWGRMPPPQVAVWKPPTPRIRRHAAQKSGAPVMRIKPRAVLKSPIAAMATRLPVIRINPPLVRQPARTRRSAARTNPHVVHKSAGHCGPGRSRVPSLGINPAKSSKAWRTSAIWFPTRRLQNPCKRRFQCSGFRFQECATYCGLATSILSPETCILHL